MSTPTPSPQGNTEILVAIARLETKLDSITNTLPQKIDDHESRIRSLEKNRWPLPSVAVLVSIVGAAISYFVK